MIVPNRLERWGIASVDGISKSVSESWDSHFVGDLFRLRLDTYGATQLRTIKGADPPQAVQALPLLVTPCTAFLRFSMAQAVGVRF